MKKEHTLIMVSSDTKPQINQIVSRKSDTRLAIVNPLTVEDPNKHLHTTQHLYILSNEILKSKDYSIHPLGYIVRIESVFENEGYNVIKLGDGKSSWMAWHVPAHIPKSKIVATTNPELWATLDVLPGNEGIPKIGIDFVDRFVKEWNKGNKIEKVLIEYNRVVGSKGNESHPPRFYDELELRSNGTVIISPVEEKKYSKYHLNMAIREAIMYPEKFMTGIVHDDKKSLAWVEEELKFISK